MKCALHTHTTFSDGQLSPEEMVQAYRDQGFDCVAITDHKFMVPPNYSNYLERLGQKLQGQVMVLAGAEIDFEPWSSHHLIEIPGKNDLLRILCHPRAYFLTPGQVNGRIQAAPFKIDCIEVSHRGFYTPEYDLDEISCPKIATDDSHELYDIARCWIETERFADPDSLFRAIRAGDFQIKMA